MLTMSNSFEMYHRQQQQQQQLNSATSTSILSNSNSSKSIPIGGPGMCSGGSGSGGNSPSGAGKESIHSGQFMVSHFEAEEAQDDDDSEIKMLDPEDPSLSKPDEPNACTEVQLYMPIKVKEYGSMSMIASHLEIETSLTKLFKCMNLAYSQKLTSPKWNHFKGVRLRWKDKIRLNNVIWRCWHMQFILKRRTPVCQFASPLDVDIHSNPQSVVLEGKYWKRQLTVIKAEYRKWRRNSKSNKTGCMIYDTKSEIDLFEWSSLPNDRNLMLPYDWTTDTLFSAINGPFPFPDQREIARGAGNSDFIQPSLGPLQPNLDEIGLTFEELLLQSTRLPPVPEEVSDDMLKSVDYGFPALLGPDQMDSTSIVDVTNQNQEMSNGEDTNMMELNTPLSSMQYSDLERQFRENANNSLLGSQSDLSNSMMMSGNQSSDSDFNSSPKRPSIKTFPISLDSSTNQSSGNMGKSVIKGRISKTTQRPFRREPHNYDKAQPTLHQTEIYQQMMAERLQQQHQQQHQLQQHMQQTFGLQLQPPPAPNQSHQTSMQMSQQFSQGMLNNNNNSSNNYTVPQAQTLLGLPTNSSIKTYPVSTKNNLLPNVKLEATQPSNNNVLSMFSINTAPSSDGGFHHQASSSMGNLSQVCSSNGNTSSISFKPYPNVQSPFQKSASTGNYINMRSSDTASAAVSQINALLLEQQQQQQSQHMQQHSQSLPLQLHQNQLILPTSATNTSSSSSSQQQPQQILPKEMFRSNSLPLNSSLQKLEARIEHFAVPKYQAKSNNKSRSRSNSIQQQNAPSMVGGMSSGATLQIPQLQGATSDPMLNSTLAQLLTAPSIPPPTPNALNTNTNYSPSVTSSHTSSTLQAHQQSVQQQHHAQHQSGQSLPKPISPKKSNSLPVPAPALMIHSPPGNKMLSFPPPSGAHIPSNISLSPDSFHEQDSPLSPTHNLKYPRDTQRRAGHIHAEQKRRYNIKNGFDMLHSLIPQLQQNPNAKLSKAAMLQKGADYIKQLRSERNLLKEKMEALKQERDSLNSSLTHLHSILPANGAPVTRQRTERVRQLYEHYVRCRTMRDWKFWILGLILEPLLTSYTTSVSSASADELRRTVFLWVDQHCSLVDLRPAVSNKLRYLSTTTDILSDPPSTLQEEVAKAINNTPGQHPNLNGT